MWASLLAEVLYACWAWLAVLGHGSTEAGTGVEVLSRVGGAVGVRVEHDALKAKHRCT